MTSKSYFCNKCKRTHYSSGKIFYKHLKSSNSPRKKKIRIEKNNYNKNIGLKIEKSNKYQGYLVNRFFINSGMEIDTRQKLINPLTIEEYIENFKNERY